MRERFSERSVVEVEPQVAGFCFFGSIDEVLLQTASRHESANVDARKMLAPLPVDGCEYSNVFLNCTPLWRSAAQFVDVPMKPLHECLIAPKTGKTRIEITWKLGGWFTVGAQSAQEIVDSN